MKTSELTGAALDWAVANIEEGVPVAEFIGLEKLPDTEYVWKYRYSTNWAQGGPIIEREIISIVKTSKSGFWSAYWVRKTTDDYQKRQADADTALVAAMRCYVLVKLGDDVEIPKELL